MSNYYKLLWRQNTEETDTLLRGLLWAAVSTEPGAELLSLSHAPGGDSGNCR